MVANAFVILFMSFHVIKNIRCLVNTRSDSKLLRGDELKTLPYIENAYLIIKDGLIAEYGKMDDLIHSTFNIQHSTYSTGQSPLTTDASGSFILPCWCDSHTHLVFAASREEEFIDKIKGLSYADIAAKGGGILNSAKKLGETDEDVLYHAAYARLYELIKLGTGAIEIKSGYGLTVESVLKMLRVINRLKENVPIPVKATFLGAHAYPVEYKNDHEGYIKLIINEMLPAIAREKLADYIDVFCEEGFFSAEETIRICKAGIAYGLKPRLHVNQLNSIGGIEAGIALSAVSLDHLETLTADEIKALAEWDGVCTLLPTAAFFLRMQYQPARALIDAGCAVSLASDYNPGSSPSGNMNFVTALSCIQMKMLPEEAINASTINGAYAMEIGAETGSITVGKRANLIFTKPVPSLAYLPYAFGSNLVEKVMINGIFVD